MKYFLLFKVVFGLFSDSIAMAEPRSVAASSWRNLDLDGGSGVRFGNGSLSRKKRFIFPAVSAWRFDLSITLFVPLDGTPILGNPFIVFIPFTFNLNTLA